MSLWSRLANLARQDRLNRDLDEEMASHVAEAIERGRDPEEARRAFGPMLQRREESRDIRLVPWLDSLRADAVFGWRLLRKNGVASWAAILSLALAMGASMSAFRLVDALLLRRLPVANADRLYVLTYPYTDAGNRVEVGDTFDYPQFAALRRAVELDAELLAISRPGRNGLTFASDEDIERFSRQSVSGRMFAAFGLRPAVGRLLTEGDDVTPGAHPVAVLSHDYWTRRFRGDPAAVGRRFRMGTDVYDIVGVAQQGFTGTEPGAITDIFVPTMMNAAAIGNPTWSWIRIWVQLRPGASAAVVRERLRAAVAAWRAERVKTWPADTPPAVISEYLKAEVTLEPAGAGFSLTQVEFRRPLAALGALVLLVLLIACVNVANLMTAQGSARVREMAMRISIGAGRWRLAQLVLVESAMIAALASLLGVVFAWWAAPFVVSRLSRPDLPVRLVLAADWRVTAFAAALTLAVALTFGVVPALRAASVPSMSVLRGGDDPSRRKRRLHALIAAQVAFCVVVQLVAGLFVATFHRLSHQPTGFTADRLLTLETVTRRNERRPLSNWREVLQHLKAVDGVESVALCGWALMTGNGWSDNVAVNGTALDSDEVYFLAVSPGWLQAMGIRLIDGRDLAATDTFAGTAIVNEAFARRYFNGRDPVGRTFDTRAEGKLAPSAIVGYAADARYRDMREPILPTAYVPFPTDALPEIARPLDAETPGARRKGLDWATIVVRLSPGARPDVAQVLRREVTRARPEFRVVNLRTQAELVDQHTLRERLLAILSGFFAAVALLLAGVGIYGSLHQYVQQRRRDLGIRIALGASPRRVVLHATSGILSMLVLGTAGGIAAGFASQRYVQELLYQVTAADWTMLALPVGAIGAAAVLAALPPVVRALRIDPATTLRAE